ncbi:hypothetical protein BDD43_5848 [Mucilaginibacter gracilis]|uniref:Uncharacterized protein n=1 Tax=Mucilaginibacter gracilis TaxID=423350 RepID=A0A495J9I9_9SPHI|nr:hypothetical protein BDD43_5848 [Mucilaginibacter gracilis]
MFEKDFIANKQPIGRAKDLGDMQGIRKSRSNK